MSHDFLKQQTKLWDGKARQYGASYQGVDYPSPERQILCWDQLTKIWRDRGTAVTVLDYGCGYGALLDYLTERNFALTQYIGFDVSEMMLRNARKTHRHFPNHSFVNEIEPSTSVDYVICSGVFNNKLDAESKAWQAYVLETLDRLWKLARKGMAFNILTNYSDPEKMRADLFYADPCFFFDYCKRNYSRDVALLHDYGIYEFTVLVRRSV